MVESLVICGKVPVACQQMVQDCTRERAKEASKEYHDAIRRQKKVHWDDFLADGRAQKIGAQAITGSFRTVSTAVAEAEASIQTVCERHAQAGTRFYINIKTLPKTHAPATLRVSVSRRYMSPLKRLVLAHEESGMRWMETIQAYTVPPWHNRVTLVCDADCEAAIAAANDANDIVIATSASDRGELVGMGASSTTDRLARQTR
jgi:hypothetical protein